VRCPLNVVVTVGMGPFPFDRLVGGLNEVCSHHNVFVQTGTSTIDPPCPSQAFLDPADLLSRLAGADVVVTHGGNTVRQVQRLGKVPICVARRANFGEMSNDHQVHYLESEAVSGRVVVVERVGLLSAAIDAHPAAEQTLRASRPLPAPVDPNLLADFLDLLADSLLSPTVRLA
jgi:UDP-N-acetylglucosamine transferase subunit ALG13